MFKNVASQKIAMFAFDVTTGAPKTGDAANLTAYVNKDWAGVNALADTSATEIDSTNAKGWYLFDVSQSESNGDALNFTAKSSTANVSVVGSLIYTLPPNFTLLSINGSGLVDILQTAADKVWSTATRELTAFSSSFKTGFRLSSTGIQDFFDALTSGFVTVGSFGKLIVDNINATISSRSTVTTAQVNAECDQALADVGVTTTVTGRIDAAVSTRSSHTAAQAGTDAASKVLATPANLLSTNASGEVTPTAASKTGYRLSSTGIADFFAYLIEGSHTFGGYVRLQAATLFAILTGAATSTVSIRDVDNTKDRISANVDSDGNRNGVTILDET